MKKVRLSIDERKRYQKKMVIEVPDDMNDERVNELLDILEDKAQTASDITRLVEQIGIKVVEITTMTRPIDAKIEIDGYSFID